MTACRATSDRLGLSLAEVVVAVAIIAVMSGVAVVSFHGSVNQARLGEAAERLSADLRLVREDARTRQQPAVLAIDTVARRYQAAGVPSLERNGDLQRDLSVPPYEITAINAGAPGAVSITFDAQGRPDVPRVITLRRGQRSATVTISEAGDVDQTP